MRLQFYPILKFQHSNFSILFKFKQHFKFKQQFRVSLNSNLAIYDLTGSQKVEYGTPSWAVETVNAYVQAKNEFGQYYWIPHLLNFDVNYLMALTLQLVHLPRPFGNDDFANEGIFQVKINHKQQN